MLSGYIGRGIIFKSACHQDQPPRSTRHQDQPINDQDQHSVLERTLGGDPLLGSDFGDMSRVTVRRERSSISRAIKWIVVEI